MAYRSNGGGRLEWNTMLRQSGGTSTEANEKRTKKKKKWAMANAKAEKTLLWLWNDINGLRNKNLLEMR